MSEFEKVQSVLEYYDIPEGWLTAKELLSFLPNRFLFSAFGKISSFDWLKKNPHCWKRIIYEEDDGTSERITLYSPDAQEKIKLMLRQNGPLVSMVGGRYDTYDLS